jgi:hypothetical protein
MIEPDDNGEKTVEKTLGPEKREQGRNLSGKARPPGQPASEIR